MRNCAIMVLNRLVANSTTVTETWRGQGVGARENRGRERAGSGIYMRAGSGIYMRARSGSRNKEGDSLLFITGYYSIKNTYLAKF